MLKLLILMECTNFVKFAVIYSIHLWRNMSYKLFLVMETQNCFDLVPLLNIWFYKLRAFKKLNEM